MSRRSRRWGALCVIAVVAIGLGWSSLSPLQAANRLVARWSRHVVVPSSPTDPAPRLPRQPQRLILAGGHAWAHPPRRPLSDENEGPPLTVFLHGACGAPEPGCGLWREAATARGWLLCPSGPRRCGQAWDWSGPGEAKAAHLARAVRALAHRWGDEVAERSGVLVGFSRGAFAARDILYAGTEGYRGVIFIGAALVPDPARLKAVGVRRVVFACGDHDGARPTMVEATARLRRAGLPARFVSTGPVWHQLPPDLGERLGEPLRWVAAP